MLNKVPDTEIGKFYPDKSCDTNDPVNTIITYDLSKARITPMLMSHRWAHTNSTYPIFFSIFCKIISIFSKMTLFEPKHSLSWSSVFDRSPIIQDAHNLALDLVDSKCAFFDLSTG